MKLAELDKKIMASFKRNPSYASVERETGIERRRVERRVMKMRVAGYDLPELQPIGVSTWKTRNANGSAHGKQV